MNWDVRNLPVDHWSSATGEPEYPGGKVALANFIDDHLNYPEDAVDYAIEGIVRVAFTISANGCIKDITILEGLGYGCDHAVLRLVEKMPCWKPAVSHGKVIEKTVIMPVSFRLKPTN